LGTIRSLEYVPQNFEERLAHQQRDLADSEKQCRELEAKVGQIFEHEARLESLGGRQKELEEALDITKNQAANSLAAEETEVVIETKTETESVLNDTPRPRVKIPAMKASPKIHAAMAH